MEIRVLAKNKFESVVTWYTTRSPAARAMLPLFTQDGEGPTWHPKVESVPLTRSATEVVGAML
jgi:hypothetical protein